MLFNVAIFSSLLLAPVVLAVPSGLSTRIARRHESFHNLERDADSTDGPEYTGNWAGAMWTGDNGTFNAVTGTFTVPTPSGSNGASGAVWVAIDGGNCTDVILETGVVFTAESDGPTFLAFCDWYPADVMTFPEFSILAGDVLRLSITASSPTDATTMIENLTNGQTAPCNLNFSVPLCGRSAGWMVEVGDSVGDDGLVDFGTVTFTDATASGGSGITYTPNGAEIVDIVQNGSLLTSVSTSGDTVTVEYIPPSN